MISDLTTNDPDIRAALHYKRLRQYRDHPDTLIVDELGLAHAKSRIDVAVINGCVHGYEIKSAQDTLIRLATQIEIYAQALQKLTIVSSPRHLKRVLASVPEWCGIIEAVKGPRQAIHFQSIRPARNNPDLDPVMLAHLLWRSEVIELLSSRGFAAKQLRHPRKRLYEMLAEVMTPRQITAAIRAAMVNRKAWRDRPAHV